MKAGKQLGGQNAIFHKILLDGARGLGYTRGHDCKRSDISGPDGHHDTGLGSSGLVALSH